MPRPVVNPFENLTVAATYEAGRPYFHPIVMQYIHKRFQGGAMASHALDIGCGTGLSSKALLDIAQKITAIDGSKAMLDCAYQDPRITYQCASAEEISFPDKTFDLISLSQIIHWIDHEKVFGKVRNAIRPNGLVAIYDNFFLWSLKEEDALVKWFKTKFIPKFPAPGRHKPELSAKGELVAPGFAFAGYDDYSNPLGMTKDQFVSYLLTLSHVAASWERGEHTRESAGDWLRKEIEALFAGQKIVTFPFGGFIYYLRPSN